MTHKDRTFCEIIEHVKDISGCINDMYNVRPGISIVFINQYREVGGASVSMYKTSDMYIELTIPHNYTLGRKNKITIAVVIVHEYCHYLKSLEMGSRERVVSVQQYPADQLIRRADEQRNWNATKKMAKNLGLWNKLFYNIARECYYTSALQF